MVASQAAIPLQAIDTGSENESQKSTETKIRKVTPDMFEELGQILFILSHTILRIKVRDPRIKSGKTTTCVRNVFIVVESAKQHCDHLISSSAHRFHGLIWTVETLTTQKIIPQQSETKIIRISE